MTRSYTFRVFGDHVQITEDQDGVGAPKIYAARIIASGPPVYGYGTTAEEAIVDVLRQQRRRGAS